jgi:hypothetical protein
MPRIQLNVPLAAKRKGQLLLAYQRVHYLAVLATDGEGAGPMNPVAGSYAVADAQGIGPSEFITLAKKVGLKALAVKSQHTEADL